MNHDIRPSLLRKFEHIRLIELPVAVNLRCEAGSIIRRYRDDLESTEPLKLGGESGSHFVSGSVVFGLVEER
jgi:hypothetical protein